MRSQHRAAVIDEGALEMSKVSKPVAIRQSSAGLKGDASTGVRAHPSYDHPGLFYAVELNSRRRVFNGYMTVEQIRAACKSANVRFAGVVSVTGRGQRTGYDNASVAAAVAKHGKVVKK